MKVRLTVTAVVTLLAAVVVLIVHGYRQDLRAARARIASGSKLISTACGPIEYADVGSGPPALVIHGAGGGFDQGLDFGRPLIAKGFRVIAPSRFGYLRTPLPADASPMAQADAHACLLDALKLDKVAVFGGSAGAPSAMQLCLRHPERCSAMVLGVPLTYNPSGRRAAQGSPFTEFAISTILRSDFMFWAISKLAHDLTVQTVLATPPADVHKASADEQARVAKVLDHIEPISQREKGLGNDARIAQSLPRYELERFAVPTLVFSVEDDLFNTYPGARYTAEHIPSARFIGYPTGGHLWVGHQRELWSEVAQFLKNAE